jgi:hypothetical protein
VVYKLAKRCKSYNLGLHIGLKARAKLHPRWYHVKMQELLWRIDFFIFTNFWTPNLVSKVPNFYMETNFLINKVKNSGKFLFTSCLLDT